MNKNDIYFGKREIKLWEKEYRRNLINSLGGYKSINLIGSIVKDGKDNLAIFNTVIHVGSNPPLMGLLFRTPVVPRHTLTNIRETNKFTINHITPQFYNKAHQTAARYKKELKSEFDIVGLNRFFSTEFPVPYVEESPVKIGLEYRESSEIRSNGTIFLVGEIVEIIVLRNSVLSDGLIDLGVTQTITSSGLDTYYTTNKIARLSYANPNKDLDIIG